MNRDKLQKIIDAIEAEIDVFSTVMDVTKFRHLQKQLEKYITTDAVTGAFNRWKIEEVLEKEINRARHNKSKMGVMMIDVDQLKQINDIHGHNTGDLVLRKVSHDLEYALDGTVGRPHRLGRWGGDEFVYILFSKDIRKIRKAVEICQNSLGGFSYQISQGDSIPITLSFGLAWLKNSDTFESKINNKI